jgi:MFS family permease
MCFALFMVMLDNTVVNVSLPSIQRDLHASLSALEWTVNAYTLTFAVLMVTGGRLGDIFGRRSLFLFGVMVFGASSLAIGFAPSDHALVAFRAAQGVGAAFMMPATLSIITQAFPPEQRGTAIGTWAGVSALALAIGPVLGGLLTQDVGWRAIFFINPPIAVMAVAVTMFAAANTRDETVQRSVDVPGIAALTIGLTALVLALVEANSWHWGSRWRSPAWGCSPRSSGGCPHRWSTSASSALARFSAPTSSASSSASRCWRSSSSSPSTCRTSCATRRCRRGSGSCPRRCCWSSWGRWPAGSPTAWARARS